MDSRQIKKMERSWACYEGMEWFRKQKNLKTAWETCKRGDWMDWLLAQMGLIRYDLYVPRHDLYVYANTNPLVALRKDMTDAEIKWEDSYIRNERKAYLSKLRRLQLKMANTLRAEFRFSEVAKAFQKNFG